MRRRRRLKDLKDFWLRHRHVGRSEKRVEARRASHLGVCCLNRATLDGLAPLLSCWFLPFSLLVLCTPCIAKAETPKMVVFGDSWTDTGNERRFTDGLTWHEYLAVELGRDFAGPSSSGGLNYGTGAARLIDSENQFRTNHVPRYVGDYLETNTPQPQDLFGIWAGAADIIFDGRDVEEVVAGMTHTITTLAEAGAKHFVVNNVPLVGDTPRLIPWQSASLNERARGYQPQLKSSMAELSETLGVSISVVDVLSLHENVLDDPESYGVSDPRAESGDLYVDNIHFRTFFHKHIADEAKEAMGIPANGRIVGGWRDTSVDYRWDDINVATSGTATQSSDQSVRRTPAQNAIDLDSSTIAQTSKNEDQHWWQVDLGQATALNSIIIENGGRGSRNLTDGGGFSAQVLAEDGTVAYEQSFKDVDVNSLGMLQIDLPQDEPIVGSVVRLSKLDPVKSSTGGTFKLAEVQVISEVESFEMGAEETWFFEIDAEADTSDVLEISGQLDIKGSHLDLALLEGDLNAGDMFDLLNSDGISGEFATISLPVLADSLQWNTTGLYVDGSLSVVLRGDFDNNGKIDPQDIDLLSMGEGDPAFDLSGDGLLGVNDVDVLLGLAERLNGDLDFSGTVDLSDFLVLSNNFGSVGKWTAGDLDLDGQIAFADFLILSNNFGQTAAAAVPEPTSLSLFALCLGALSLRRRGVEYGRSSERRK